MTLVAILTCLLLSVSGERILIQIYRSYPHFFIVTKCGFIICYRGQFSCRGKYCIWSSLNVRRPMFCQVLVVLMCSYTQSCDVYRDSSSLGMVYAEWRCQRGHLSVVRVLSNTEATAPPKISSPLLNCYMLLMVFHAPCSGSESAWPVYSFIFQL